MAAAIGRRGRRRAERRHCTAARMSASSPQTSGGKARATASTLLLPSTFRATRVTQPFCLPRPMMCGAAACDESRRCALLSGASLIVQTQGAKSELGPASVCLSLRACACLALAWVNRPGFRGDWATCYSCWLLLWWRQRGACTYMHTHTHTCNNWGASVVVSKKRGR